MSPTRFTFYLSIVLAWLGLGVQSLFAADPLEGLDLAEAFFADDPPYTDTQEALDFLKTSFRIKGIEKALQSPIGKSRALSLGGRLSHFYKQERPRWIAQSPLIQKWLARRQLLIDLIQKADVDRTRWREASTPEALAKERARLELQHTEAMMKGDLYEFKRRANQYAYKETLERSSTKNSSVGRSEAILERAAQLSTQFQNEFAKDLLVSFFNPRELGVADMKSLKLVHEFTSLDEIRGLELHTQSFSDDITVKMRAAKRFPYLNLAFRSENLLAYSTSIHALIDIASDRFPKTRDRDRDAYHTLLFKIGEALTYLPAAKKDKATYNLSKAQDYFQKASLEEGENQFFEGLLDRDVNWVSLYSISLLDSLESASYRRDRDERAREKGRPSLLALLQRRLSAFLEADPGQAFQSLPSRVEVENFRLQRPRKIFDLRSFGDRASLPRRLELPAEKAELKGQAAENLVLPETKAEFEINNEAIHLPAIQKNEDLQAFAIPSALEWDIVSLVVKDAKSKQLLRIGSDFQLHRNRRSGVLAVVTSDREIPAITIRAGYAKTGPKLAREDPEIPATEVQVEVDKMFNLGWKRLGNSLQKLLNHKDMSPRLSEVENAFMYGSTYAEDSRVSPNEAEKGSYEYFSPFYKSETEDLEWMCNGAASCYAFKGNSIFKRIGSSFRLEVRPTIMLDPMKDGIFTPFHAHVWLWKNKKLVNFYDPTPPTPIARLSLLDTPHLVKSQYTRAKRVLRKSLKYFLDDLEHASKGSSIFFQHNQTKGDPMKQVIALAEDILKIPPGRARPDDWKAQIEALEKIIHYAKSKIASQETSKRTFGSSRFVLYEDPILLNDMEFVLTNARSLATLAEQRACANDLQTMAAPTSNSRRD